MTLTVTFQFPDAFIPQVSVPFILQTIITDIQANPQRKPTLDQLQFAAKLHELCAQFTNEGGLDTDQH